MLSQKDEVAITLKLALARLPWLKRGIEALDMGIDAL
jgi:hypothetical protein